MRINKKLHKSVCIFFQILFFFVLYHPNTIYAEYIRENAVVRAVNKVSAAVVNISSEYEVHKKVNPFSGFGLDPFFDSFFRDFFEPGLEQQYKKTSLGSGVIIDGERGFILTNAHVIAKAGKITAVLKDEREFETQIVGADPDSDLAILRIDSKKPLPAIDMGDSDDLMIGETVIAIGNPFGFSNTVTTGVISALNRSIRTDDRVYHNFIQTDASINPGNSGGPLLNINGELIGINTAIYAKAQGIGFAIPINRAKRIISDLIQYGEVIPAWIGINIQNLDVQLAQYLKLSKIRGILVKGVESNGPANKAGILEGDIILSIENRNIQSPQDYLNVLKDFSAGDNLRMEVWRNGKIHTFSIVAEVFPVDRAMDLAYRLLGIKVEELSIINRFKYKKIAVKGVQISELDPQSYLARIGVRRGDIIRQLDEMIIKNTDDFKKAIIKYHQKTSLVILLQRGDQGYYITVKL
ncbi:MAG: Do family serine endopeptidase [Desulfobacterales bacterium]|nr:Do family serine endopeptidase [Desulfobacterales bacterium]